MSASAHNDAGRGELSRKYISMLGWVACGIGLLLVILPLLDIVGVVTINGVAALNENLFTKSTGGAALGMLNAIEGTFVITICAMVLAVPIGIGAGISLAEFGNNKHSAATRFMADVLTGTPSIVIGYFSYIVFIISFGWGFSLAAAAITLAIIIVPYLARITELALRQVPREMREASYALAGSDATTVFSVVLPAASSGVVTGTLLALAISVGETAPLIYTAGWSDHVWDGHFTHSPVGYLTYVIWTFIDQPDPHQHAMAYAAAFLVMLVVLTINIGARLTLKRSTRLI